jgi:hypothetical protein
MGNFGGLGIFFIEEGKTTIEQAYLIDRNQIFNSISSVKFLLKK